MSTRNLYFKACSHYRWRYFKMKSPPLSLFEMLLATKGLSTWIVHIPLAIHHSWWFILFALTWVHPSCTFSSPFFECFVLLTFRRFSLLLWSIGICAKCYPCQISKAKPTKSFKKLFQAFAQTKYQVGLHNFGLY
jgi:hypothetical protein